MKICGAGHTYEPVGNNRRGCPTCKKAKTAAWTKNNAEKIKADQAAWRQKNIKAVKAKKAAYYKKHTQHIIEKSARWGEVNKLKRNKIGQRWRARNQEKHKQMRLNYRRKNPDKYRNYLRKQKKALKRATPAWADKGKIQAFYDNVKFLRTTSGLDYTVDHIIPLCSQSVSGLHVHYNLQILTRSENAKKAKKYDNKF